MTDRIREKQEGRSSCRWKKRETAKRKKYITGTRKQEEGTSGSCKKKEQEEGTSGSYKKKETGTRNKRQL